MLTPAQLSKALDRAAEAAHDTFYGITTASSSMGLCFEDADTKKQWREVAAAMLAALEETNV